MTSGTEPPAAAPQVTQVRFSKQYKKLNLWLNRVEKEVHKCMLLKRFRGGGPCRWQRSQSHGSASSDSLLKKRASPSVGREAAFSKLLKNVHFACRNRFPCQFSCIAMYFFSSFIFQYVCTRPLTQNKMTKAAKAVVKTKIVQT